MQPITGGTMVRKLAYAVSAALAVASGTALAQQTHTKVAQRDWNPAAAEGRCTLRVWVDDTALLRLRGDDLWVETVQGDRSYDQGSTCTQPLPASRVRDFRITYDRGRGRVEEVQVPSRRNDYTGTIEVQDPQNGAALYVIDVAWSNAGPAYADNGYGYSSAAPGRDPAPGYDMMRACQEQVRAEFVRRNTGDAYLEFSGTPASEPLSPERQRVYGAAYARNRSSTREVNYECVLNDRTMRVENIAYQFEGPTRGAMR
jgi:hypothetical protein